MDMSDKCFCYCLCSGLFSRVLLFGLVVCVCICVCFMFARVPKCRNRSGTSGYDMRDGKR